MTNESEATKITVKVMAASDSVWEPAQFDAATREIATALAEQDDRIRLLEDVLGWIADHGGQAESRHARFALTKGGPE